ncbi:MAG: uroporphyrinogen decarboxylase [Maricaulis sp.]|jgi:uroporphyrinogen decarboxylase|nr:uroporphyrinogen decarboxylase [Maricaulis sp.]HAQ36383.1 uroporphyrinogen decarboxylase [Alphaproteobacteria bacterium]
MNDLTKTKSVLAVLSGERRDPPPAWLMRQAGRYLPEYREVRSTAKNFIEFCLTPDKATEVTLQPIRRFGFDAAILFADILLVPMALGRKVWFVAGEGPKLDPLTPGDIDAMQVGDVEGLLGNIGETVSRVSAALPGNTTLIGFAGSPWTVATYMIEGGGSKDRMKARALAWSEPERFDRLMDLLADATIRYLVIQARAGAEVLKLFDSWAEGMPEPLFERAVLKPTAKIVGGVRAAGVTQPMIGFARGCGAMLPRYAAETGVTAVALDQGVDPVWADAVLPAGMPVQGQLDPAVLRAGGPALDAEVKRNISAWAKRPHIFNLGHGVTPDVPIAHVEQLLATLRQD